MTVFDARFKYNLRIFTNALLPWAVRSIGRMWTIQGLYRNAMKAQKRRMRVQKEMGFPVPPTVVFSITSYCNLSCDFCYSRDYNETHSLPQELFEGALTQAKELGCFFFTLTGGEPLLYPNLLEVLSHHPDAVFFLITNGTRITSTTADVLSKHPNIIPIISLEGGAEATDRRRGEGVYQQISNGVRYLRERDSLFGFSITVTSQNCYSLQKEAIFEEQFPLDSRLGFFIEYVPAGKMPDYSLCLTQEQRSSFRQWFLCLKASKNMFLVHFPGDEELLYGCREAGKGFVHINPQGFVEPCALIQNDKYNINKMPFKACLGALFSEVNRHGDDYSNIENHPCMASFSKDFLQKTSGSVVRIMV
ncbi:MAG: radical SAM protein [Planctomycetes bacterium]|nr:radical SAM protein [Planctomycetota bacterium]